MSLKATSRKKVLMASKLLKLKIYMIVGIFGIKAKKNLKQFESPKYSNICDDDFIIAIPLCNNSPKVSKTNRRSFYYLIFYGINKYTYALVYSNT